jgi:hypothetical protein
MVTFWKSSVLLRADDAGIYPQEIAKNAKTEKNQAHGLLFALAAICRG